MGFAFGSEYLFLFIIGLVWTIFAVVQDFKSREISNWLNFSLVGIALAYRAFYGVINGNLEFFIFGVLGFAAFFILAHVFYYSRIFAGGDAKLLMGFGILLPYSSYTNIGFLGLGFVFLLLLVGAVYSLVYSFFIIFKRMDTFSTEFGKLFDKTRAIFVLALVGFLFFAATYIITAGLIYFFLGVFLISFYFLFIYVKALDKCMTVLRDPKSLTEGDWLEYDVKLSRGKTLKKSVHGLSLEEIKVLRKAKKKVYIKEGVPFAPVFLITLIMVFFYPVSKFLILFF